MVRRILILKDMAPKRAVVLKPSVEEDPLLEKAFVSYAKTRSFKFLRRLTSELAGMFPNNANGAIAKFDEIKSTSSLNLSLEEIQSIKAVIRKAINGRKKWK